MVSIAHRRSVHTLLTSVVVLLLTAVPVQAQISELTGFQPAHDYVAPEPWERIDTQTGNVVLIFTDLEVPGNGGRSLQFTRTFNSKDGAWTFGIAGLVLRVFDWWWDNILLLQCEDPGPILFTADGGKGRAATQLYGGGCPLERRILMNDRFWRYDRETRTLWMPDGTVSQFGPDRRLQSVVDRFGNELLFEWQWNEQQLKIGPSGISVGDRVEMCHEPAAASRASRAMRGASGAPGPASRSRATARIAGKLTLAGLPASGD